MPDIPENRSDRDELTLAQQRAETLTSQRQMAEMFVKGAQMDFSKCRDALFNTETMALLPRDKCFRKRLRDMRLAEAYLKQAMLALKTAQDSEQSAWRAYQELVMETQATVA